MKFLMVLGSVVTAVVSGEQFRAALIQAVYHIQNYSADLTEYYTSSYGANSMQLTDEDLSEMTGSSVSINISLDCPSSNSKENNKNSANDHIKKNITITSAE